MRDKSNNFSSTTLRHTNTHVQWKLLRCKVQSAIACLSSVQPPWRWFLRNRTPQVKVKAKWAWLMTTKVCYYVITSI